MLTSAPIAVGADQAGEALIPADKLNQIVRECQAPTVSLENDKQALFIRSGESKFKVYGFDPAEAPPIKSFEDAEVDCEIRAGDLLTLKIEDEVDKRIGAPQVLRRACVLSSTLPSASSCAFRLPS